MVSATMTVVAFGRTEVRQVTIKNGIKVANQLLKKKITSLKVNSHKLSK